MESCTAKPSTGEIQRMIVRPSLSELSIPSRVIKEAALLACKRRKLVSWGRKSGKMDGKDTRFALQWMEDPLARTELCLEDFLALMTLLQF